MRYSQLDEGVTFKNKQKNEALNRKDINVGIEYEFQANYDNMPLDRLEVGNFIESGDIKIDHVQKVVAESNDQVEIVTDTMTIGEALKHIQKVFTYFNENTKGFSFETINQSGMHISISYKNYAVEDINFLKFALLMSSNHFTKLFPVRDYVDNFDKLIDEAIEEVAKLNDDFKKLVPMIERRFNRISGNNADYIKYHGIKLSDYSIYDGRIELRFFGGNGYENRFDDIKQELARAIHVLGISYSNEYDDVYYKELYKRYTKVSDTSTSIDFVERILNAKNWSFVDRNDAKRFLDAHKAMKNGKSPRMDVETYLKIIKKFFPNKVEKYLKDNKLLQKRPSSFVYNYFKDAGMLEHLPLFFNEDNVIEYTYELIESASNGDITYDVVYDLVEDSVNDYVVAEMDMIDEDELNDEIPPELPPSKIYFNTIIVPLADFPSPILELYDRRMIDRDVEDDVTKVLERSIGQLEESLSDNPKAQPMIDITKKIYRLLDKSNDFVNLMKELVNRVYSDIQKDMGENLNTGNNDLTETDYTDQLRYVKELLEQAKS